MENLHKNIQLMLEFFKGPFTMLMILLSTLNVIKYLIYMATSRISCSTWICSTRHCGLGQQVTSWFQCWKNSASFVWLVYSGAVDVKIDGSVLEEKSSFKMLRSTFFSNMDWGLYMNSIAQTAYKKIQALICSMMFVSPEAALELYKSTILPCIEYCCGLWAGAPSCYLE